MRGNITSNISREDSVKQRSIVKERMNDCGVDGSNMITPPPTSPPLKRPNQCRSSLEGRWPQQRSHSMHLGKHPILAVDSLTRARFLSSTATRSLKDLSSVANSMTGLLGTPKRIEISPSMIRAKMDCQVSPGVVERRLSELRMLQFPNMNNATGRDGYKVVLNDEKSSQPDHDRHLSDREFPSPPRPNAKEKHSPKHIPDTNINFRQGRQQQQLRPSKLQRLWPPVLDSQKNQHDIDQRRDKTSREIQRAISSRSSGTVGETRSFYEKVSCCNQNTDESSTCNTESTVSLTPTTSPVSKWQRFNQESPGSKLPPRVDTLDNEDQHMNAKHSSKKKSALVEGHLEKKPDLVLNDEGISCSSEESFPTYADIVLPSGQRLPRPKGRKKTRRTNYRISYQGPTLLRLEDVYGNLMEIPEVDNRFSTGLCDERPLMKPLRGGGDAESHHKSVSRHHHVVGKDSQPSYPTRRRCGEDDVDDDHSMSEDEPNEPFVGNRPDVWITPLKSFNGSRTWKVKRVWGVDLVDDEEPEYEVDHSFLMASIRE
jgi:hypothetical protein